MQSHEHYMSKALALAQEAFDAGEIPIGAVVVWDDKIIGRGRNMTEQLQDVTAHAEMIAITAATNHIGAKYLNEATLYVTIEPCLMCSGALYWSKIGHIVYGAEDEKNGYRRLLGREAPPTLPEGEGSSETRPGKDELLIHGLAIGNKETYEALKTFSKQHRSKPTETEAILWDALRSRSIGHKFRRQHVLLNYIADFIYLPKRLIIEIDGLIHQLPSNAERDEVRSKVLEDFGFKVIRFTNDQVLNDLDSVILSVQTSLQSQPTVRTAFASGFITGTKKSHQSDKSSSDNISSPSGRSGGANSGQSDDIGQITSPPLRMTQSVTHEAHRDGLLSSDYTSSPSDDLERHTQHASEVTSPFHPRTTITTGILATECAQLMKDFFKSRR